MSSQKKKGGRAPKEQKGELIGGVAAVVGISDPPHARAAGPVTISGLKRQIAQLKSGKSGRDKKKKVIIPIPQSPRRTPRSPAAPGSGSSAKVAELPISQSIITATKRADFDTYHTDALFAWGSDYDGWTLTQDATREEILDELAEGAKVPQNKEAMELAWIKFYGNKRPYLHKDDEDGELEESDEEELAEVPSKKQRISEPVSSPPPAISLPSISQEDIIRYFVNQGAIKIPSSVAVTESQELINARAIVAAAAAASSTCASSTTAGTSSIASTATPRVDSDELECQRLIATGEPYPLFEKRTTITAAKAAQILRGAFGGVRYAQVAEPRLALVRSGKMINPCYVVPLMAGSEERQAPSSRACDYRDAADARPVLARGRSINNIAECILAGFTIMAALAEQPEAMFNWMALLASVVRLDKERNWTIAHGYLLRVLQDKVPSRLDFGTYDPVCGNSAIQDGMQNEQSIQYTSVRDTVPNAAADSACYGFNSMSGCRFGGMCRHQHKCSNVSCMDRYANNHNALSCPSRDRSSSSSVRSDPSSRGGRGGRGGKSNRGGRKVSFSPLPNSS